MPPDRNSDSQDWDEGDWELLLGHVVSGQVIPIIGKDLLKITPPEADKPHSLYPYLAQRLLAELRVSAPIDPEMASRVTLNDAVCAHRDARGIEYQKLPVRLRKILREIEGWAKPTPLQQLAEITDFRFFVTTTFDALMQRAIERTSLEGRPRQAKVMVYNPNPRSAVDKGDLPDVREDRNGLPGSASSPWIYHLMGRVNTDTLQPESAPVVLTDEELLDFVCALNSENKDREPVNLLNEFARHHLLLLGCSFSDWLARLFLRATKRRRRVMYEGADPRTVPLEYVVDDYEPQDRNLVVFVERFWQHVRIYRMGNVVDFVEQLHRRWKDQNGERAAQLETTAIPHPPRPAPAPALTGAPKGGIFISYAREDEAAARRLHQGLSGLPAWLDRAEIEGGEEFADSIENAIKDSKIFMPIISENTNRRARGFFWREWNLAADYCLETNVRERFIWPVSIDAVDAATARVPRTFLKKNWSHLPEGHVSTDFLKELHSYLDKFHEGQ